MSKPKKKHDWCDVFCEKCDSAWGLCVREGDRAYAVIDQSAGDDLQAAEAKVEILEEMAEELWKRYGNSRHCTANEAREDLVRKAQALRSAIAEERKKRI